MAEYLALEAEIRIRKNHGSVALRELRREKKEIRDRMEELLRANNVHSLAVPTHAVAGGPEPSASGEAEKFIYVRSENVTSYKAVTREVLEEAVTLLDPDALFESLKEGFGRQAKKRKLESAAAAAASAAIGTELAGYLYEGVRALVCKTSPKINVSGSKVRPAKGEDPAAYNVVTDDNEVVTLIQQLTALKARVADAEQADYVSFGALQTRRQALLPQVFEAVEAAPNAQLRAEVRASHPGLTKPACFIYRVEVAYKSATVTPALKMTALKTLLHEAMIQVLATFDFGGSATSDSGAGYADKAGGSDNMVQCRTVSAIERGLPAFMNEVAGDPERWARFKEELQAEVAREYEVVTTALPSDEKVIRQIVFKPIDL